VVIYGPSRQLQHDAGVRRETDKKRRRNPGRQRLIVDHAVNLGKVAQQRVLVNGDRAGEEY